MSLLLLLKHRQFPRSSSLSDRRNYRVGSHQKSAGSCRWAGLSFAIHTVVNIDVSRGRVVCWRVRKLMHDLVGCRHAKRPHGMGEWSQHAAVATLSVSRIGDTPHTNYIVILGGYCRVWTVRSRGQIGVAKCDCCLLANVSTIIKVRNDLDLSSRWVKKKHITK